MISCVLEITLTEVDGVIGSRCDFSCIGITRTDEGGVISCVLEITLTEVDGVIGSRYDFSCLEITRTDENDTIC
ncbi:hypothetical protein [Psychroserpens ponticola]|uniref:Uncharacterized protein n=1 Tax=Psychroserpens ponticola TaxID=2932268 RepID=A0ABY7S3F7_9FLAO|nr:hypothetical protein [Psychroserpens ponticola]WCO03426.1 hypothetical protein MUN68_007950 [Psychroserpens ponticola]